MGILGLPNVGKSTLFNAITSAGAESANYPFCTIEPNIGVVSVPDNRLDFLTKLSHSKKTVPTAIEFYDIAGLVKGASRGEGLGNKFLSHIREVAAIVHVVRCFESDDITHVEGNVDPIRDIDIIDLELILADLEVMEKRRDRVSKALKGDKSLQQELELIQEILTVLENEMPVRTMQLNDDDQKMLKSFNLLTSKPVLYAANVNEESLSEIDSDPNFQRILQRAKREEAEVIALCSKIEAEIAELDPEEKLVFLEDLGIKKSGLEQLIQASYKLLGLVSFFTTGPQESRAWPIKKGTKAPQAAGKIHSDIERGFIRAEVVAFDTLQASGSMIAVKEKGQLRLEGKEYIVKDGDVILFRFNV